MPANPRRIRHLNGVCPTLNPEDFSFTLFGGMRGYNIYQQNKLLGANHLYRAFIYEAHGKL